MIGLGVYEDKCELIIININADKKQMRLQTTGSNLKNC